MKKIDLKALVPLIIGAIIEWLIYSFCILSYLFIFALFNGEWSWKGLWQTLEAVLILGAGLFVYAKISDYHEGWQQRKANLRKQDEQNQREFVREIARLTQ